MGASDIFGIGWYSPLQMGRRIRNMRLNTIRDFATDLPSDHINTWNITANETWDFDIQMYEDIIVKTGNTLNITCKIRMLKQGRIIVEKGAKLIVDAGEITTWSKSGLWDGIYIEGSGYGTPQNLLYQGQVEVKNGGTLTNAKSAINAYLLNSNGGYNLNTTGGIIMCDNANFINNIRDVEYIYYQSQFNQANGGFFKNCNFKITGNLNGNAQPLSRVLLFDIHGVQFLGCKFENSTPANPNPHNIGILSFDSKFTLDKLGSVNSEIKGFKEGIRIDNTNPLNLATLKNTNYINNYNNSIYINNTNNLIIEDNYFTLPSQVVTPSLLYSNGLYLNNCKFYNVRNNSFNKTLPPFSWNPCSGITVNNSQNGAHNIYRNNFSDLTVGIIATDNNSGITNISDGLRMNCNNFTTIPNLYDIALTSSSQPPTVDRNQGTSAGSSPSFLVRNRYAAPVFNSGGEYQFFIELTSAKNYLHVTNSNANAKPIPQPDLSDVSVSVSGSIPYASNQCPPTITPPNPCPSCNKLTNLNSSINNAQLQSNLAKTSASNLIDGGNTTTLVAAINSNISNGNLKNLLESKSPYLSDAALTAYFTKSNIPSGHIKEIHELNAPVSASVWQTLQTISLSNGIRNQINAKQNEKKFSQRDELDAYVAITTSNLKSAVAEKLNYFATDSLVQSQDSLIKTLQLSKANIDNANEQLFFAYLSANKSKELNNLITVIKASNLDYGNYLEKLVSLNNETNKAFALLTNENLYNYFASVSSTDANPGSAGAKALLKIVKDINYAEPRVLPDGKNKGYAWQTQQSLKTKVKLKI